MKTTFKLILALILPLLLIDCKKNDDNGPVETEKDKLIAAVLEKSWSVDAQGSSLDGVSGVDAGTTTISFIETDNGLEFTLGGDVQSYVSGGAVTIDEDGSITSSTVNVQSGFAVSSISFSVNDAVSTITITFSVAEARVSGIGVYNLVFTAS